MATISDTRALVDFLVSQVTTFADGPDLSKMVPIEHFLEHCMFIRDIGPLLRLC